MTTQAQRLIDDCKAKIEQLPQGISGMDYFRYWGWFAIIHQLEQEYPLEITIQNALANLEHQRPTDRKDSWYKEHWQECQDHITRLQERLRTLLIEGEEEIL